MATLSIKNILSQLGLSRFFSGLAFDQILPSDNKTKDHAITPVNPVLTPPLKTGNPTTQVIEEPQFNLGFDLLGNQTAHLKTGLSTTGHTSPQTPLLAQDVSRFYSSRQRQTIQHNASSSEFLNLQIQINKQNEAIDRLFNSINFLTEAESLLPENIEKSKAAFRTILREMDWKLAEHAFDMLLKEKHGRSRSGDKSVPDWYHELREVLPHLAMARKGALSHRAMNDPERNDGGLEVLVSAALRHDSWEDYGFSDQHITSHYHAYISALRKLPETDPRHIKPEEIEDLYNKATQIAWNVKLMTKKTPVIDEETGRIKLKDDGRTKLRIKLFQGLEAFYKNSRQSPLAILGRDGDKVEGLSTRLTWDQIDSLPSTIQELEASGGDFYASLTNTGKFSLADNKRYADNIRRVFGRSAVDDKVSKQYPSYELAFRTMDDLAGIDLCLLEAFNNTVDPDAEYAPRDALPLRLSQYVTRVKDNLSLIPPGFSSYHIFIGRLEAVAKKEWAVAKAKYDAAAQKGYITAQDSKDFYNSIKINELLEYVIYPAMKPLIGHRHIPELSHKGPLWHDYIEHGDNPAPSV